MSALDTRNVSRDSLFLFAELAFDGQIDPVRVKVRNLSVGGMMAEGGVVAAWGARLTVKLRNIGDVKGTVAWVQGNRFGIAFDHEIDPQLARAPIAGSDDATPRYGRPAPGGYPATGGHGMRPL
ncbi:PilZ domain-containing protein [Erythrobacter mangrovi]|uniref:PilZ domain-containing protein n=1 Tax=Erythrobacter mangrovi TaxID=2739433 RepID=A0A7D4BG07_9SPHN|nr:PilZ domain-containing protein [Erythrobacter mangrovi]QKG71062.1 PilZ domain-containing protein [Erythrobacter mangrovi]